MVNIVDATRRAVTEGKKLVRPWGERRIVIQPTDSSDCCMYWCGERSGLRYDGTGKRNGYGAGKQVH